nr:MAG TPA: hypothetical protein [Caudoviricetes sp.]
MWLTTSIKPFIASLDILSVNRCISKLPFNTPSKTACILVPLFLAS